MGGRAGELGTSIVVGRILNPPSPLVSVFKLSWLGFRFIAGICGFMNEGDDGSETRLEASEPANGGWIESPFMLRPRLGDGEVIGLSRVFGISLMLRVFIVDDKPPNVVAGNEFSGIRLIGESGEDDGEGSDNEDVSVVKVVVGDESADSEFCVEVLSLCRCRVSVVGIGRKCCCSCCA